MRYGIIWTWVEDGDVKQRVSYFTTLQEALDAFNDPSFGEAELFTVLQSKGAIDPATVKDA